MKRWAIGLATASACAIALVIVVIVPDRPEPALTPIAPASGIEWLVGSEQQIRWKATGLRTVGIDISRNDGSECISAGGRTRLPKRDLAGHERIADGIVDMGAYEFGSKPAEAEELKIIDPRDPGPF